ncbi:MFS transporter [Marichromatium gracile]|uniref:MFS transporter n=1 Tax=Marichromatium gracile TaxID=1048 RepID=A0A4R4A8Q9_MARGR|nr:MFS transporter [Marichromatium gracile]MBK1708931.1 MFS transporter [Marichromatium gracile]TCW34906.1 MFS transporter [Marichromatium gracile]
MNDPTRTKTPRSTWWLLASLYTTQYLGLGFFVIALAALLREQGAPLDQISLVYMLGLLWALKFLWAPLVDRIGVRRWGHYRGWLMLMQAGMMACFLLIGAYDLIDDFSTIYLLCVVVALLSATQDIAADGLACRLIPAEERGTGNGIQVAGGLLGNMLGGGVVLMAYPYLGWVGSMVVLALATGVALVQLLVFREPRWPVATTARPRLLPRIGALLRARPGRYWLAMLLLYPLGYNLMFIPLTPILVDLGWSVERIGFTVNVFGSVVGIIGALAAGWVFNRVARRNALTGAALLQIIGVGAVALPLLGMTDTLTVMLAIGAFFLFCNPATTVLAAVMMDHASHDAPATDYSLQFSLSMGFAMVAATVSTSLAEQLGYLSVIWTALAVAVVALLLALPYRFQRVFPEGESSEDAPALDPAVVTGDAR